MGRVPIIVPRDERAQEAVIDDLATEHGAVCVSPPYADGSLSATIPNGTEFLIGPLGSVCRRGVNFSIDWEA